MHFKRKKKVQVKAIDSLVVINPILKAEFGEIVL